MSEILPLLHQEGAGRGWPNRFLRRGDARGFAGGRAQSEPIPTSGWRRASSARRFTSLAMSADIPIVPIYARHFAPCQLQFITTGTYRRTRLFTWQMFCWTFVETLRQVALLAVILPQIGVP